MKISTAHIIIYVQSIYIYFFFFAEAVPNKAALGKIYKKDAKNIIEAIERLSLKEVESLEKDLKENRYTNFRFP